MLLLHHTQFVTHTRELGGNLCKGSCHATVGFASNGLIASYRCVPVPLLRLYVLRGANRGREREDLVTTGRTRFTRAAAARAQLRDRVQRTAEPVRPPVIREYNRTFFDAIQVRKA
jgi:hypothetical protein